jgi:hypothetical protein
MRCVTVGCATGASRRGHSRQRLPVSGSTRLERSRVAAGRLERQACPRSVVHMIGRRSGSTRPRAQRTVREGALGVHDRRGTGANSAAARGASKAVAPRMPPLHAMGPPGRNAKACPDTAIPGLLSSIRLKSLRGVSANPACHLCL